MVGGNIVGRHWWEKGPERWGVMFGEGFGMLETLFDDLGCSSYPDLEWFEWFIHYMILDWIVE